MKKKYANQFSYANLESCFDKKVVKVKSKGIDKKSAINFKKDKEKELKIIDRKIQTGTYKFSPYLELLRVKKRRDFPRLLSLPTIRDRIVLDICKEILHADFSDSVNRQLPNSFIRKIKNYLAKNKNRKIYFLKTDITKFYDEVNRKKLIAELEKQINDADLISVLNSAIETPTVPSNYKKEDLKKYSSDKGIPQGLPISNILAQIYLKPFDDYFKNKLKTSLYLRYVDDILILAKSDCKPLLNSLKEQLKSLDLKVNDDKTEMGNLDNKVEFLGYTIHKGAISISSKTIETQINKIAAKVTWFKKGMENPKTRPLTLINDDKGFKRLFLKEVNEIITGSKSQKKNYGWLFYYLEIDDVSIFYKMDKIIDSMFKALAAFNYKPPKKLKRTVRAYFEIKFNKGGNYVWNYDKLNTITKKRKLLDEVAQTDATKSYSEEQINSTYEYYRDRNLGILERDVGYG